MFIDQRERKWESGGESHWRERETPIGHLQYAPARNRTGNPGMHPDRGSNLQPLGVQDDGPNNGATQPGLVALF